MEFTEKMLKKINEVKYLTLENANRYRAIIRYMYIHDKQMKFYFQKDEIYRALKESGKFEGYTIEACEQDLKALESYNNIVTQQDPSKQNTIEEFQNKQFNYQLTELTKSIEEMMIQLEGLNLKGSSLDSSLLEFFKDYLEGVYSVVHKEPKDVNQWWEQLSNQFQKLNQEYHKYIRQFYSIENEELLNSESFKLYINDFIKYINVFISDLQKYGKHIENLFTRIIPQETVDIIVDKLTIHYKAAPRLDGTFQTEEFIEETHNKWKNMKGWFTGYNYSSSEWEKILLITSDIIRKISYIALQYVENKNSIANRKDEYRRLAELFNKADSLEDCHKLSAFAFGVAHMKHVIIDKERDTDSIFSSVYSEEPFEYGLKSRSRSVKEKAPKRAIQDRAQERRELEMQKMLERRHKEELIKSYVKDGRIEFNKLPMISREVRATLLRWIGKAHTTGTKDKSGYYSARNEYGNLFKLIPPIDKVRCVLECEDGQLDMPAYVIEFM